MSKVYFISDLHMGHRRVIEFENFYRGKVLGVSSIEEHDEKICDLWNDTVKKRDLVYVLGDIGFSFNKLKGLPGNKYLHLGNHDDRPISEYLDVFDKIVPPFPYKKHWIAHIPLHESELRGRRVIHGHTHSKGIPSEDYINVCVEMTKGYPISFQNIVSGNFSTFDKVNKPIEEILDD